MYFEKSGVQNTEETLKLAVETAKSRGINTIVLSTVTGVSVEELLKLDVKGLNIVAVTHVNGFKEPGVQELSLEKRQELEAAGVKVVTTTHVLSGAERGISRKFGGVNPVEIISYALRMLGQGTKVAVEVAVMALDSGYINYMEPIISMGGTGRGLDTAIIMRTAHGSNILDCKIDEIICKPILN
ncbi:MAG: pyruvate kinase alpha/beta domain-containing protein [Clostridium sp.]